MNTKRWATISFGIIAALSFLLWRQITDLVWDWAHWPVYDSLGVGLPDFVAAGLALGVFLAFSTNKKAKTFGNEVVIELSKVTWPARKETVLSAVIVTVMVGIASVILSLFDVIWGTLAQKFLSY